jgi:SAM-dependent methyltransferase
MYDRLASAFETIFPTDLDTVLFAIDRFGSGEWLDLACGTGGYAIELARRGYKVLGVDIAEAMIQNAVAKAQEEGLDVRFEVKDMASDLGANRFGGVLFIGNSLVHANDLDQVKTVLNRVHDSLANDGVLILQILNYDRILDRQVSALPLIERDGVRFERRYVPDGDHLLFQTVLTVAQQRVENEVRLFPIRSVALKTALTDVGFEAIEFHDDFTAMPFDPEVTHVLVATARKGKR